MQIVSIVCSIIIHRHEMCMAKKKKKKGYAEDKNNVNFHWLVCLLKLETVFFSLKGRMLQKVIACCFGGTGQLVYMTDKTLEIFFFQSSTDIVYLQHLKFFLFQHTYANMHLHLGSHTFCCKLCEFLQVVM